MNYLIHILRSNYRIPRMYTIAQFVVMSQWHHEVFGINYHTKKKILTSQQLLSISDDELIAICFTK